jgi:hypothetical protein
MKNRKYLKINPKKLKEKTPSRPIFVRKAKQHCIRSFDFHEHMFLPEGPGGLQRLSSDKLRPPTDLSWDTLSERKLLRQALSEELGSL